MVADPPSIGLSASSISSVVVFPAPFGPKIPNTSPGFTSKLTPSTTFLPPYVLTSSFATTIAFITFHYTDEKELKNKKNTPLMREGYCGPHPRHYARQFWHLFV